MARETAGARDGAVPAAEGLRSRQARRLILIGLLVPCLSIVVPAVIVYRAERQLARSFHWVEHTLKVERQLKRVLTLIVNAETGQRGFLLTSSDTYLEPYYQALAQLPGEAAELDSLTLDNPVQQEHLRELGALVAAQLEFMAETVSVARRGDGDATRGLDIDRGKKTMDAIRARLNVMEHEEARLLVVRQEQLASHARASTALLFTLVVLSLLFALAMLLMLRRLFKLRELVKICAWSRMVEYQGEWLSFEQYLQRRFNVDTSHGISPVEAERVSRLLHTRPHDAS